jgi:Fic family protein
MENFLEEYNVLKNKTHPVILAIFAHLGLVNIHPFVDGNGRTARLICNSILINEGYQLINITLEKKTHYMMSLYESYINKTINNPGNDSFYKFMAVCELQAQKDYCNFFNLDLLEESEITDYKID